MSPVQSKSVSGSTFSRVVALPVVLILSPPSKGKSSNSIGDWKFSSKAASELTAVGYLGLDGL